MTRQQRWDSFLITSFYKRSDVPMSRLIEIYNSDVRGLLRLPSTPWQNRSSTRVFICNCLPKEFSTYLWTKEITDAYEIALTLPEDSYGTIGVPYSQFTPKDRARFKRSAKEYNTACTELFAALDFKDKSNSYKGRLKKL